MVLDAHQTRTRERYGKTRGRARPSNQVVPVKTPTPTRESHGKGGPREDKRQSETLYPNCTREFHQLPQGNATGVYEAGQDPYARLNPNSVALIGMTSDAYL